MAQRRKVKDYTEKPDETRTFASGIKLSQEEHEARCRANFEQIMAKHPTTVVIHGMGANGDVFTAAAGPPMEVMQCDEVGFQQLIDMLRRGAEAAERNG